MTTRKLQNAFFLLIRPDGLLDIFVRTPFADGMILISSNAGPALFTQDGRYLLQFRPDFQAAPMIATVVLTYDQSMERLQRTGQWGDHFLATMYELAGYANATVEPIAVFGAPKTGLTPEGEWDDWVMPLIDGTGVITQLFEQSIYVNKFIFSSEVGKLV